MYATIYTIHGIDEEKLTGVISDILRIGKPQIRIVDCGDYFVAIEGCHRIEAAKRLGITVNWEILHQDDLIDTDSLDTDYFASSEKYTAGEIARELYSPHSGVYKIDTETGNFLE